MLQVAVHEVSRAKVVEIVTVFDLPVRVFFC